MHLKTIRQTFYSRSVILYMYVDLGSSSKKDSKEKYIHKRQQIINDREKQWGIQSNFYIYVCINFCSNYEAELF